MNTKGQEGAIFFGITGVLIIIAAIVLLTGFDYVPAGNVGVKDRLGVVNPSHLEPGVYWTGVFTGTERFSTRIQLKEYGASAASQDLQMVNTKIALNFKVNPTSTPEIYKTIGTHYQDIIIAPVIQEAVKSSTAKYNAENLIKERTKVKQDITDYITNKLRDKGLIVTEVSITDFVFSNEFNQAIEEKQVAEQNALTAENKYREMEWTAKSMQLQSEVIEIKKLDLQREWISKWDGQLPLIITSDNQGMFMQMDLTELSQMKGEQKTE